MTTFYLSFFQQGCNKVYTSTSDVLGHENFHKKNATLLNEGFQRFRATEDCGNRLCEFYGQKTTHFHCQRHGCNFVFKNKYDIERHKTFHTKDDIYKREGFKKFSKHEVNCLGFLVSFISIIFLNILGKHKMRHLFSEIYRFQMEMKKVL